MSPEPAVSNWSVMIVDDEPTTRLILTRLFKRQGYKEVLIAENGQRAIERLREKDRVDMVVCDLMMPDMDGITLIKNVRRSVSYGVNLALVVLSGEEDMTTVQKCLEAGADSYLLKPITVSSVQTTWENIWRKNMETQMRCTLESEVRVRQMLSERVYGMENDLQLLQNKYSEAVDLPVNALIQSIDRLSARGSVNEYVREAFSVIVQQLISSAHYNSVFSRLEHRVEDMANSGLDGQTVLWLKKELRLCAEEVPSTSPRPPQDIPQANLEPSLVLESKLGQWVYDCPAQFEAQLLALETMFVTFQLPEHFGFSLQTLRAFLLGCSKWYHPNPYHNFLHAFDVAQAAYVMLTTCAAAASLSRLEILCILVSCVAHDLDHPGLNNSFQCATHSQLAIRYNDASVLENHHCASLFFRLAEQPNENIFAGMAPEMFTEARRTIIQLILSTDLSQHFGLVSQLQGHDFDGSKPEMRLLFCKSIVKAADISNQCRAWSEARRWTLLLQEEFFIQGDRERKCQLPVSPFMDRQNSNTNTMVINFITFICRPLYDALTKWLPLLQPALNQVSENLESWKSASNS